jgi:signal transduction histidine kinase
MNYNFARSLNAMVSRATSRIDGMPPQAVISRGELHVRMEERRKERARIARDLHDTLFQGFLGASMVLDAAVAGLPSDSPSKLSLNRALLHMRRVIDEGRSALLGLRSPGLESSSLECALADLGNQFMDNGACFKISVLGHPKPLQPGVQEEVLLIAREALLNACRHSQATRIEAEIEYLPARLRLAVRDNGSGIDPQVVRFGRESHWGLQGMRERARNIGGRLRIWSKRGAGTEVEVSVPGCLNSASLQA